MLLSCAEKSRFAPATNATGGCWRHWRHWRQPQFNLRQRPELVSRSAPDLLGIQKRTRHAREDAPSRSVLLVLD